jgi:hypothetical protein
MRCGPPSIDGVRYLVGEQRGVFMIGLTRIIKAQEGPTSQFGRVVGERGLGLPCGCRIAFGRTISITGRFGEQSCLEHRAGPLPAQLSQVEVRRHSE